MSVVRIATYQDLQNAFRERAKLGTALSNVDSGHLEIMQRLLNETYNRVAFHKEWPWRIMHRFMQTTAKSTTGTVDVTNGGREITFSAAVTVDATMQGKYFRVDGDNEWYEVIAVHDAASRKVMLGSPYAGTTDTTASYTLYKFKYGLWPDVGDVHSIIPMTGNALNTSRELDYLSPNEYMKLFSTAPFYSAGSPQYYTIMGQEDYAGVDMGSEFITGYDFMEDDPYIQVDKAIWFYPTIVDSTTLHVKYGRQIEAMTGDNDEPLVPLEKRHVILYGALEEWHATQTKDRMLANRYAAKFKQVIGEMTGDFDRTEEKPMLVPDTRRRKMRRGLYGRSSCSCPGLSV